MALVHACSSSSNENPSASPDGGKDAHSALLDSACYACLAPACATETSACKLEPECAGFLECATQCPPSDTGGVDPTCTDSCPKGQSAAATTARANLIACWSSSNCAACGGTPDAGGDVDSGASNPILHQQCPPSGQTDACFKCLFEKCCDSLSKVLTGGSASDLQDCVSNCSDSACDAACYQQYPDQVTDYASNVACNLLLCDVECTSPSACSTCMKDKCSEAIANCFTKKSCFLAYKCWGGGATDACKTQYPDADPEFDVVTTCITACPC